MKFEFDNKKSASNKAKHGLDFLQAQDLWKDKHLVTFPLSYVTEERFIAIGKIQNKSYSAIFTYRNKKIRLISVRRSREEEVNLYENH